VKLKDKTLTVFVLLCPTAMRLIIVLHAPLRYTMTPKPRKRPLSLTL
jgi:hypothetical protein